MINIKNRLELFWDETMIDVSKTTAKPKVHEFIKRECVIKHDEPWEGDGCDYHNILTDNGLYRMYYLGWNMINPDETEHTTHGIKVCYMESNDGINWIKPKLGLRDFCGSKENNIILDETDNSFDNFHVMIDENPACQADEKYKGIGSSAGALWCWVSHDGINFKKGWMLTNKGYFDTLNVILWDEATQKYMGYIRGFHDNGDGSSWGTRDIRYMESVDFKNWSDPQLLDFGDADDYALYTNCVSQYYRANHVLVGFPSRYVERREWTDTLDKLPGYQKRLSRFKISPRYGLTVTDLVFMTSRDGFKWKRYDEALAKPGPEEPYNWVYGDCYPSVGMIETPGSYPGTDNELSMYMFTHHWMGIPAHMYRYTIRIDGFVSYHATYKPQILTTKPFIFDGDELIINFSTSAIGYLYIKIKDEDGNEINSYEIFGDKIDRQIGFIDGSPSQFKGKPVVMEIKMSDADIYSFKFE
ncbi:MAG: hypothetical protein FWF15_02190 [Oscillospiraceae bacterium]|nr:hypothetical protein [Oscillospiraceae bacterium]